MDISNQRPVRSPEIPQSPEATGEGQPSADEQPLPIDPEKIEKVDEVDESSDDSFPASDPPSYSRSSATKD